MTRMEKSAAFSRRALLKSGGALVVSIGMPISLDTVLAISDAHAQGAIKPALTPDQLSSYIAVNADGTVAAFFGKMDMGHGITVAIGQMVAEELDVPFKAVKVYMGDTATSVHQGGASGSTGIQLGGKQMRMAAAEARRVLVEMAAQKLALPADQLTVVDGVIQAKSDPAKKTSYAELIGGRYFNVQLDWNKQYGNTLYAPGKALPKKPSEYKIVGKPIKREDIAPKVFAQEDFVTDVKVPGMVHARMIRPPVAGSVPVKVDESSIADIPTARVVWQNGFLGVVADKEWDAIQAMGNLKVEWSQVKPPFPPQASLFDVIRKSAVRKRVVEKNVGNVDDAFKTAARVIEAEYEWPFQSHASMGPACAFVEIKDGFVTCYSGTQKSHFVQAGLAATLDVPLDKVRVKWMAGPGSYGRNDADDCAMDAAVIAKAIGRPVRLQYMREQGTGWDPKGPASIHRARLGFDAAGKIIAYEFTSKGFSRVDVDTNGGKPRDTLAGQTLGVTLASGDGFGVPAEVLRVPQQAPRLGDHCAAARPRLAAAQFAPARSGRAADPLRQRVLHRRGGGGPQSGPGPVPAPIRQGSARRGNHQGGGGEVRLGDADLAAARPDRRQGQRPRHRLFPAQRHPRRRHRRGRYRPLHRQDLGEALRGRP